MNETELRRTLGQLFEGLPELTDATVTIGGQLYRARRNAPWVLIDAKAPRGWNPWTEWPLPAFRNRYAAQPQRSSHDR